MASNAASSSTSPARIFSKIRCAKISKDCKQVIANVYARTRTRFPEMSVREILERVSNDSGVCARTVAKYNAQCLSGKVASLKRRPRNVKVSSSRTVKHDEFTLKAIRLKVHRKYSEREIPTLDSILEAVNEDDELPELSKTHPALSGNSHKSVKVNISGGLVRCPPTTVETFVTEVFNIERALQARAAHYPRISDVAAPTPSSCALSSNNPRIHENIRDIVREELKKLVPAAERPASLSIAQIVREEV
ncbi:hypothetical protein HPB47_017070 [Ixodes persulcatus]|uniref:Uncharacterized protein n=1 Tax=Ixodes persulcatus TaxID=34615 RepID=A0AC60QSU5_IXOPE|nr:hypothetical protein HPB47_017070 [Ixodes persulcatus]